MHMCVLLLVLLSCVASVNAQTTIYASPNGKAGNAGTMASPWDLNTAINNIAAGTTLQLLPGNYSVSSLISVETPGTAAQPITMQGNGEATLVWTGPAGSSDIFQVSLVLDF